MKQKRLVDEEALRKARLSRCCICRLPAPNDPSHVRSRGAGGPDTEWNVVPMCRPHHTEWHAVGPSMFLRRYQGFELYLRSLGWEVDRPSCAPIRLWHPNLVAR